MRVGFTQQGDFTNMLCILKVLQRPFTILNSISASYKLSKENYLENVTNNYVLVPCLGKSHQQLLLDRRLLKKLLKSNLKQTIISQKNSRRSNRYCCHRCLHFVFDKFSWTWILHGLCLVSLHGSTFFHSSFM